MQTKKRIEQEEQKAFDVAWYTRHVSLGRPEVGEAHAKELEAKYPPAELHLCEVEYGELMGRLATLRWVLGVADDINDSGLYDT